MRRADHLLIGALALQLSLATACAKNPAPDGWLKPAPASESDPYGGWIQLFHSGTTPAIAGEFLAFDHDSVYVLGQDGRVRPTPVSDVTSARIAFYDAQNREMITGNSLGAVSTLTHGFGLVFTAPILWGIVGSSIVASNSKLPLFDVKTPHQWAEARKYARFPAGLPPDLPRTLPVKK